MRQNTKVTIRKTIFIVLSFITLLSVLISIQTSKQYEELHEDYIEQVIKYNKLSEKHLQLTDQHWTLQQQLLKEEAQ